MSRANGYIDGSDAVAILNCSTERTALQLENEVYFEYEMFHSAYVLLFRTFVQELFRYYFAYL